MIVNIISMGLIGEHGTLINKIIPDLKDLQQPIGALKMLRPIRLIYAFPILKRCLDSLVRTLPRVFRNFMALIIVMIFYSILGLHLFAGALEYRCRESEKPTSSGHWPVVSGINSVCGRTWSCPKDSYCGSPADFNLDYDSKEKDIVEFNFGFTNFDNFGNALFTVFHMVRTTGWSSITFIYWKYLDPKIVSIYFLSLILLSAYILINLLLGVLYEGFLKNESQQREQLDLTPEERKEKEIEDNRKKSVKIQIKDLKAQLEETHTQHEGQEDDYETKKQKAIEDYKTKLALTKPLEVQPHFQKNKKLHQKCVSKICQQPTFYYQESRLGFRQKFLKFLITTPALQYASNVIIVLNCIVLALNRHPIRASERRILILIDFICTIIYLGEVIVKIIFKNYKFFRSAICIADLTVVVLNIVDILIKLSLPDLKFFQENTPYGQGVQILKFARLYQIFYYSKWLKPLDEFLLAFIISFERLAYYIVIIIIYAFTFGCIACELFAYKARFEEYTFNTVKNPLDGVSPRINFDNLPNSFTAILQFILNEEWHMAMYDYMRSYHESVAIFWVILILTGELLVMKLFLALFINTYLQIVNRTINEQNDEISVHSSDIESELDGEESDEEQDDNMGGSIRENGQIKRESADGSILESQNQVQKNHSQKHNSFSHSTPKAGAHMESINKNHNLNASQISSLHITMKDSKQSNQAQNNKNQKNQSPSHQQQLSPSALLQQQQQQQQDQQFSIQEELSSKQEEAKKMFLKQFSQASFGVTDSIKANKENVFLNSNNTNNNANNNIKDTNDNLFLKRHSSDLPSNRPHLQGKSSSQQKQQQQQVLFSKDSLLNAQKNPNQNQPNSTKSMVDRISDKQNNNINNINSNSHSHSSFPNPNKTSLQISQKQRPSSAQVIRNSIKSGRSVPSAGYNRRPMGSRRSTRRARKFTNINDTKIQFSKFLLCQMHIKNFVKHKYFEYVIMVFILISCIVLALETPLNDPNSLKYKVIRIFDIVTTSLFGLECALKIFSFGFCEYIKVGWNIIDFVSFIISLQSLIFSTGLGAFKGLRALRILKVSRFSERIRFTIISILKSTPLICYLMIFAFTFLAFLGLIPVTYLKGKLYYCASIDNSLKNKIQTKQDCFDYGGDWVNNDFPWDNLLHSIFNLFTIATCEGWSAYMFSAWDAVGVDEQPQINKTRWWTLFFIVHFFVGNLMVFNTFIGVLIEKFSYIKNTRGKYRGLDAKEKEWAIIKDRIYSTKPLISFKKPANCFLQAIYRLIHNNIYFDKIMDISIICNTITFMLFYHRCSTEYAKVLDYINYFFVVVFFFEIMLKIILYRKIFFKQRFNCFEVLLLIISVTGMILNETYLRNAEQSYDSSLKDIKLLLRIFQVARAVRLIKSIVAIQKIFSNLLDVMPTVSPVMALCILVWYIYALFGVQLFAYLKPQTYGGTFDLNFRSFTSSIFSLIRVASGEQWFLLVGDTIRKQQPNFVCHEINSYEDYQKYGLNGCGSSIAYIYFATFHLILSVIILNLFIAMVLSGSLDVIQQEDTAVNKYQMNDIQNLWHDFDPDGDGFMGYKDFWRFTSQISIIYGVKQDDLLDVNHKRDFLKVLKIPLYSHKKYNCWGYAFHHVIVQLTKISIFIKYGYKIKSKDSQDLMFIENENFVREDYDSGDMATIILMQRRWKKWIRTIKEKKYLEGLTESKRAEHIQQMMEGNLERQGTINDQLEKMVLTKRVFQEAEEEKIRKLQEFEQKLKDKAEKSNNRKKIIQQLLKQTQKDKFPGLDYSEDFTDNDITEKALNSRQPNCELSSINININNYTNREYMNHLDLSSISERNRLNQQQVGITQRFKKQKANISSSGSSEQINQFI